MKKGALRSILLAIIPNDINRLFTLPSGVPAERVAAMRKVFDVPFTHPEFHADVEKADRAALDVHRAHRCKILKIN